MKTYTELKREHRLYEQERWCVVRRIEDVQDGDIRGTVDGLVRIQKQNTETGEFWAQILEPTHNEVRKGDIFLYPYTELFVGHSKLFKDWDLSGLRDDILDTAKHKNTDKINTHPVEEMYEIFEKTLNDDEVSALIAKAHRGATAIKTDGERSKVEREQAADVLDWIKDVAKTWKREKSLHPNTVTALFRVVAGTQSSNPAGWGFRTIGWKSRGDGKVPADFTNELTEQILDERRIGMTDAAIKVGALATKRWIISKGREGKVSSQINGLAALILLSLAATDRGESWMSKALATSGFFKE